jgi:tryptophan-rich sensory protein
MNKQRPYLPMAILNLLGYLGVVIVNALAVTLPLNNKTTAELSDQYPNLFVPAGLTFSIWGVVYTLLAIYTAYQLIQAVKTGSNTAFSRQIGVLFFITCVLNMGWIFAWQYEMVGLSVVIMLLFLVTLLVIYLRLKISRSDTSKNEKYLVHLPFSVYLGWISIATIANITAFLVNAGWNGFGLSEQVWTVIVMIVGIALALAMSFRRGDIYYALVVDWAFLGIFIKRMSLSNVPAQGVIITSLAGIALITLVILTQIVRKKAY